MKVKVMLDKKQFSSKPVGSEIAGVQNRMVLSEIEVGDLADLLSTGSSFKPAALLGKSSDTWESQQVFALDFDHDTTIEKTLERCKTVGIMPTFGYTSFSHMTEKDGICEERFRLVFVSDTPISDIRIRNAVQFALLALFPQADQVAKDAARLFFGGLSLIMCDVNHTVNSYDIIQAMITSIRTEELAPNATKKIQNYCAISGLNMINGLPDVRKADIEEKGKNMLSSIINNIEVSKEFPETIFNFNIKTADAIKSTTNTKKKDIKYDIIKNKEKYETIQGFDFADLRQNCRLYREFVKGDRWCYHAEVFGMATNLQNVRGGEIRMLEALESDNYDNNRNHLINTVKTTGAYGYAPTSCDNFCPFKDECEHNKNMLQQVGHKRGELRQIEELVEKDLIEAEIDLLDAMTQAYEAEDNKVYVIKAATGIGKTTALKTLGEFRNTCIAYPNHKLGNDIVDRLEVKDSIHAQELVIKDTEVASEFRRLQSIGAFNLARKLLDGHMNELMTSTTIGTPERQVAGEEASRINSYFENLKQIRVTSQPIFCTHKRMLDLNNPSCKTFIIDEDIMLSSLINTISLDLTQIKVTEGFALSTSSTYVAGQLATLKEKIELAMEKPGQVQDMPAMIIKDKEIKELTEAFANRLKINVKDTLKIRKLVANSNGEVLGIFTNELPNEKCIILSATANERVYKEILSDREVVFIDLGLVKTQGQLILHPTAFSRSALNKDFDKAIAKVKKESADTNNVITFVKYENQFIKEGFNAIAHFGACQGLDAYKGQDLIVAGTPHIDERVYMLIAATIKNNIVVEETIEYSSVRRNGFEFFFNTYTSQTQTKTGQLLQEIQFYLIESELIQAIGRARILRTDATVHLYSNLPIAGCRVYK